MQFLAKTIISIMNEESPLVSVSVVSYNISSYIIECLESIYNQTYSNIELVISDDCSTDNTIENIEKWISEKKPRFTSVKFLKANKNQGIVQNKLKAENECTGDYIKCLDGDDYLLPHFIEKCVFAFLSNPEYKFLYTNNYRLLEDDGNKLVNCDISLYKSGNLFKELFMLDIWIGTCSWMFTKSLAQEIKYDPSLFVDDYIRILRIASKYPLFWINEFLSVYRIRSNSCGKGSIRNFKSHLDTINHFKNYYLYNKRKESVLKYLSDAAEVERPSYLIIMAYKFHRLKYLKRYYSIIRRNTRAAIKKTKIFKVLRKTWLWKKFKREV
jgi:glycosyltransferase involved in cell wall biosynthesis